MKIFGHPIHIMLVHFPSALFPMDLACSLLYLYKNDVSFTQASFYAICGGVILGWAAVVFGLFDLINIFKNKPGSMNKALLHGGINSVVVIAYTCLAFMQYANYPNVRPDSYEIIAAKTVVVSFMIAGNFFGGSLVLKDRVI